MFVIYNNKECILCPGDKANMKCVTLIKFIQLVHMVYCALKRAFHPSVWEVYTARWLFVSSLVTRNVSPISYVFLQSSLPDNSGVAGNNCTFLHYYSSHSSLVVCFTFYLPQFIITLHPSLIPILLPNPKIEYELHTFIGRALSYTDFGIYMRYQEELQAVLCRVKIKWWSQAPGLWTFPEAISTIQY